VEIGSQIIPAAKMKTVHFSETSALTPKYSALFYKICDSSISQCLTKQLAMMACGGMEV